jgi:CheY-like chemotaxis protein
MSATITNRTVMIVDDADDGRELLRLQLDLLGYQVLEAANGQEAIEMVTREFPKLILMDLTMPVIDGFEATRQIRERTGNHTIFIVAVTALPAADVKHRALAAGCNDYLQKPLDPDALSNVLCRYLGT